MLALKTNLMSISLAMAALLFTSSVSPAQIKTSRSHAASSSAADRLGLTCGQILEIGSAGWVEKFNKEKDATPAGTGRAIAAYGKCYEARTDSLAASLTRKGAGPPKAVRTDFSGLEEALKKFVATALADAQSSPDSARRAYADLYAKQFRYELYRGYAEKNLNPPLTPEEDDQFHKAKNRFGELLGLLPEDKAREVHEAFGEVVGTHQVSLRMKLELYRYAIFLLEPPSEPAFAPPPF